MKPHALTFDVGGLAVELRGSFSAYRFAPSDPTPRFIHSRPGNLVLQVNERPLREMPHLPTPVGTAWAVQRTESDFWIATNQVQGGFIRVLRTDPLLRTGDLFVSLEPEGIHRVFPLEAPIGELLFEHWAAWRQGLVLHAATLTKGHKAIVVMGHSGHGKSTLSAFWADLFGHDSVLTDERTLIRRNTDGHFWAWGTPWQGSGRFSRPAGMPVAAVVGIHHGTTNQLTPVGTADLAKELLAHMLLPPVDQPTVQNAMEVAHHISQSIQGHRFDFTKDLSAAKNLAGLMS